MPLLKVQCPHCGQPAVAWTRKFTTLNGQACCQACNAPILITPAMSETLFAVLAGALTLMAFVRWPFSVFIGGALLLGMAGALLFVFPVRKISSGI